MSWRIYGAVYALTLLAYVPVRAETATLTIATVNNDDMLRMQAMVPEFTKLHPDISLRWVTLEENVLRQRLTTDIATHGGQFDIMTIGNYEVPIWAKQKWLVPLDALGPEYDVDDLLPKIRASLTYQNRLYAAPFYGESAMTYYRTDLFQQAKLSMPAQPTWAFIEHAADVLTQRKAGSYGICLRGQAGWGENINIITAMANSYGARWFDEKWRPQFDQPEWKRTITAYVHLLRDDSPSGASSNGATQALTLFAGGHCAMFIDSTVFASALGDPKQSAVVGKVGYAAAPNNGLGKNAVTLWAWSLAIPVSSNHRAAAETFVTWATSKQYSALVASRYGIANSPPGTRSSLYNNPDYLAAAPFAKPTLDAMESADPDHPTVKPVPYVGVQFVAIPEFQAIGTTVGQGFSAAVAGQTTVGQALSNAQAVTLRSMIHSGYLK